MRQTLLFVDPVDPAWTPPRTHRQDILASLVTPGTIGGKCGSIRRLAHGTAACDTRLLIDNQGNARSVMSRSSRETIEISLKNTCRVVTRVQFLSSFSNCPAWNALLVVEQASVTSRRTACESPDASTLSPSGPWCQETRQDGGSMRFRRGPRGVHGVHEK